MKVKSEDYEYMKSKMSREISKKDAERHRHYLLKDPKVKDLEKRFRWDCVYAAKLSGFICHSLYDYCNDDHIDTALKKIIKELDL